MEFSEKFKSRMIAKMVGPDGMSANVLSGEVGISQPTLSRWLREARNVPGMAKKSRSARKKVRPQRPQDWSPEEKFRVVLESRGLTDEELGAFLRKEGLHQAQLDEWSETAQSSLSVSKGAKKKASAESKRIRELERELHRKDKALAEAAALLILKKKAQAIWGDEDDDTKPRSGR